MLKIYTRAGDDGTTGLLGAGRLPKDDLRIEAYGTVDELNAVLGLARASGLDADLDLMIGRVQAELFAVGAALADPDPSGRFHSAVDLDHAGRLERDIDGMEAGLPPLTQFILPGGTEAAARVHLARATCRRAERLVVALSRAADEHVPAPLLAYLNRLGDFLFVLARAQNHKAGVTDVAWRGL